MGPVNWTTGPGPGDALPQPFSGHLPGAAHHSHSGHRQKGTSDAPRELPWVKWNLGPKKEVVTVGIIDVIFICTYNMYICKYVYIYMYMYILYIINMIHILWMIPRFPFSDPTDFDSGNVQQNTTGSTPEGQAVCLPSSSSGTASSGPWRSKGFHQEKNVLCVYIYIIHI